MTTETMLIVILALLAVAIVLLLVLIARKTANSFAQIKPELDATQKGQERIERSVREEIAKNRDESHQQAKDLRDEVQSALKNLGDAIVKSMSEISSLQKTQLGNFADRLEKLQQTNEQKMEQMRQTVEKQMDKIRVENTDKLEQMRLTVDEKLHGTLERRLGESFKIVGERLEAVSKGLGEMQTLAAGVGDLKKVLTNVKTRGVLGEYQLEHILEQILSSDLYQRNVATKPNSNERVEFAVKLPGPGSDDEDVVWLPIDAKFPQEDYLRLSEAADRADAEAVEQAGQQLEARIKSSARDIHDKYLNPPHTTDFGIMFLPTEGLYAEVLRRPDLFETLQRKFHVTIAGPTTLAALLNSLRMGFRTLAIQKRSSEVWKVLGGVKSEFGKFTDILEGIQKKLQEASNKVESAASKSRNIERKLGRVQELPAPDAAVPERELSDTAPPLF